MKHKKAPEFPSVIKRLEEVYEKSIKPLETTYSFPAFHSPSLEPGDFRTKPMILLLGQYSTGKTTFIKHLISSEFPGMHIGPEPTTDRFNIIMDGDNGITPGHALVSDDLLPFKPLTKFGNSFLNRFQGCMLRNSVLESVTFIDTPGILSGEKQRINRGYDFTAVVEWFAERVDRIILLFDAYKLDISDEYKRAIQVLRGYDEKIRIVLNKADMVDTQQLMRVYGALMWGLGKVIGTPEVCRVYIGSFWSQPLRYTENQELFELEASDLLQDIQKLPGNATMRKLNDVIKRARSVKVHAYIIAHLKNEMPSILGKSKKKQDLLKDLSSIFDSLARQYQISRNDFPDVEHMRAILTDQNFSSFPSLKNKLIDQVSTALGEEIPRLMKMIPLEFSQPRKGSSADVSGGVFDSAGGGLFSADAYRGINLGRGDPTWIVESKRAEYDRIFQSLNPQDGFLSGESIKQHLLEFKLSFPVLRQVWKLSDIDEDGRLDADEFALAKYLVDLKLAGHEISETLPAHLIPPSKRKLTLPNASPSSGGVAAELNGSYPEDSVSAVDAS